MGTKRLTALVPAFNDDYTLWLALRSYAEVFDEIIVFDDCSDDHTAEVVLDAAARYRNVRLVARSRSDVADLQQLGWVHARNELLAATDSDWLFWLDADDVLIEERAPVLQQIAEGPHAAVLLSLAEMWGDRDHTTQRLRHRDRCHVFTRRSAIPSLHWFGLKMAKAMRMVAGTRKSLPSKPSPAPLFWHCKGLKSDERLAQRRLIRKWLRSKRGGTLPDFQGEQDAFTLHRSAMRLLFRGGDTMKKHTGTPPIPNAIAGSPRRFRITYKDGVPVDREDLGWGGP